MTGQVSVLVFVASRSRQVQSRGTNYSRIKNRLPVREAAESNAAMAADQLLRSPSAVRFHCVTLSAIMRVDFIAAWLSWA
jgi:hypothetical protein